MAVVSLKQFVEAGVHFGHQTRRWNPKMEPYIYGSKHGIHIIDLKQTLQKLKHAYEYTRKISSEGKSVLFVGTKDQARDILQEEALRCNSFFINERWLGGLLTNFETVRLSVTKIKQYEEMAGPDGDYPGIIKKEALQIERKRQKLERSLGGVKEMRWLPGVIFIVDCKKEHIAVKEAQKLKIPIIAIVDTNCSPEGIDFPIPGNDDAPRAIQLYANVIATAIEEGRAIRKQRLMEEEALEMKKGKGAKKPSPESEPVIAENSVAEEAKPEVNEQPETVEEESGPAEVVSEADSDTEN